MREYQEKYIQNLKEIFVLNAAPEQIPLDVEAFVQERNQRRAQARALAQENTALLRQELFPLLDDVVSASDEDVAHLEDFAAHLVEGAAQLDMVLSYYLHNALLVYARRWEKRDMLIRELYQTAMALFYMEESASRVKQYPYRSKLAMLFGEAASFIKCYDAIEDQETRGYIHRSMANLALVYNQFTEEDGRRKLMAIRRSLRILNDPAYQEKSPDLPWDLFIYKSHQERTTVLSLLRAGIADPQMLGEVMESAEYVYERQRESSLARGTEVSLRWQYAYEAAQYHCGIRPLSYLLGWMESSYMDRDEEDYSDGGLYQNMFLPALYAVYIEENPEFQAKKKEVLGLMYRRMSAYVRGMPDNLLSELTMQRLLGCLQSFIEYPDGIQEKGFLLDLVVCRNLDVFVASRMTGEVARMLVERVLDTDPAYLLGALDCPTPAALQEHRAELQRFAIEGGLLHNVGVFNFNNLLRRLGRSWLEEERELYQFHVDAGVELLSRSSSTQPYVHAALGHHRGYDGKTGYPARYDRAQDPCPAMTDLISAAAHFVRLIEDRIFLFNQPMTLEQALERVRAEAGTRLAPKAVQLLWDLRPQLEAYLEDGELWAYQEACLLLKGKNGSAKGRGSL
ncbi:HD domain-containing phosphohydrolase [Oscillospiraceae bacterium 42-9]